MPTKNETRLANELRTLSESQGVPAPDTAGMNEQQLQEAIDSLRKSQEGASTSQQDKSMQPDIREQNTTGAHIDPALAEGTPTAGGESTRQLPPYTVAEGRSITVGGETRDAGQEVRPDDVGGQENLQKLVDAKIVQQNSGGSQPAPQEQQVPVPPPSQPAPGANDAGGTGGGGTP